jgi:archaellum biogenesis ATPase FlaH
MDQFLKDRLKRLETAVLFVDTKDYYALIEDILAYGNENFSKICYVTLTKPAKSVLKVIKRNSLDEKKFRIIDGVTKKIFPTIEDDETTIYLDSTTAITQMLLKISMLLKKEEIDLFIFDSLSVLLIYLQENVVLNFIQDITSLVQVNGSSINFIALKSDKENKIMKTMSMFVEEMMDYEK